MADGGLFDEILPVQSAPTPARSASPGLFDELLPAKTTATLPARANPMRSQAPPADKESLGYRAGEVIGKVGNKAADIVKGAAAGAVEGAKEGFGEGLSEEELAPLRGSILNKPGEYWPHRTLSELLIKGVNTAGRAGTAAVEGAARGVQGALNPIDPEAGRTAGAMIEYGAMRGDMPLGAPHVMSLSDRLLAARAPLAREAPAGIPPEAAPAAAAPPVVPPLAQAEVPAYFPDRNAKSAIPAYLPDRNAQAVARVAPALEAGIADAVRPQPATAVPPAAATPPVTPTEVARAAVQQRINALQQKSQAFRAKGPAPIVHPVVAEAIKAEAAKAAAPVPVEDLFANVRPSPTAEPVKTSAVEPLKATGTEPAKVKSGEEAPVIKPAPIAKEAVPYKAAGEAEPVMSESQKQTDKTTGTIKPTAAEPVKAVESKEVAAVDNKALPADEVENKVAETPAQKAEAAKIVASPEVQAEITTPRTIDRTHDVPGTAGSSKEGGVTYIDRNVPESLPVKTLDGKDTTIDPAKYLNIHEQVEHALMVDGKMPYHEAHFDHATVAEHAALREDGIDPVSYEAAMKPFIEKVWDEKPENPPEDLYVKPYPHNEQGLLESRGVAKDTAENVSAAPEPAKAAPEKAAPATEAAKPATKPLKGVRAEAARRVEKKAPKVKPAAEPPAPRGEPPFDQGKAAALAGEPRRMPTSWLGTGRSLTEQAEFYKGFDSAKIKKPVTPQIVARPTPVKQVRDFAALEARIERNKTDALSRLERDGQIKLRRADGQQTALFSQGTGKAPWRITYFDKAMEPTGHMDFSSIEAAAREAGPMLGNAKQWSVEKEPKAKIVRQRKVSVPNPDGILQFIASKGGIKPNSDLRAMDAHRKFVPGVGRFVREAGKDADYMREAAAEAGYLNHTGKDPVADSTPSDLYNLIDRALAGEKIRPADAEPDVKGEQATARRAAESEVERAAAEMDLDTDAPLLARAAELVMHGADPFDALERATMALAVEDTHLPEDILAGLEQSMGGNWDANEAAMGGGRELPGWEREEVQEPAGRKGAEGPRGAVSEAGNREGAARAEDRSSQAGSPAEKRLAASSTDAPPKDAEGLGPAGGRRGTEERLPDAGEGKTAGFETTEAGQQRVLPGAERISDRALAERKAAAPLRAKVAQKLGMDEGLFGDDHKQTTLLNTASRRDRGPVFVSAAVKAAENAKITKGTPDQWLASIRNTPGVKAEELKWIGLSDWLKGQKGTLTKDEVAGFIRANQIEVKDVVHGAIDAEGFEDLTATGGETKFAGYQTPGGANYREVLLTLPSKARSPLAEYLRAFPHLATEIRTVGDVADAIKFNAQFRENVKGMEPEEVLDQIKEIRSGSRAVGQDDFHGGHFDEPNVVAHLRVNERLDAAGKRTLFLDEVQSDWMQKGRKQGFQSEIAPLDAEYREAIREANTHDVHSEGYNAGYHKASEIAGRLTALKSGAVPDAPFKTSWPELAMKRAIRMAAEEGHDQIAWTTGEMQAERYDLSKQVNSIGYQKRGDLFNVSVWDKGDRQILNNQSADGKWLDDNLGKEIAQKIVDGHGRADGDFRYLEDLDLKVGGEGMKGFYDKILPNIANDLGKKFGTKVTKTEIPTSRTARKYDGPRIETMSGDRLAEIGRKARADSQAVSMQWRDVQAAMERGLSTHDAMSEHGSLALADLMGGTMETVPRTVEVHTLPITSEMRDSVMGGQKLFQSRPQSDTWTGRLNDLTRSLREEGFVDRTPTGKSVRRVMDEVDEIVSHTVGAQVDLEFHDRIAAEDAGSADHNERVDAAAKSAGRTLNKTAGGYARLFDNGRRPIIGIALQDPIYDPRTTGFHESWHMVEFLALNEKERAYIVSKEAMDAVDRLAAEELGIAESDREILNMPGYERRAIAYQRYARMKEAGEPVMGRLGAALRAIWDRLHLMFKRVKAVLSENGVGHMEDIFDVSRLGGYADRITPESRFADPESLASTDQGKPNFVKNRLEARNSDDPVAYLRAVIAAGKGDERAAPHPMLKPPSEMGKALKYKYAALKQSDPIRYIGLNMARGRTAREILADFQKEDGHVVSIKDRSRLASTHPTGSIQQQMAARAAARAAAASRPPTPATRAPATSPAPLPSARPRGGLLGATNRGIRSLVSPATVDKTAGKMAGVIREKTGTYQRATDQARAAAEPDVRPTNKLTDQQQLAIQHEMERPGTVPPAEFTPAMRDVADTLKDVFHDVRQRIEALPPLARQKFVTNYFTHIWADDAKTVRDVMSAAGYSLRGGSHLLPRQIPTIAQGIRLGLKPKYVNPIDAAVHYAGQMHNFLARVDVLHTGEQRGLFEWHKPGEQPEGWKKLNGDDLVQRSSLVSAPGGERRAVFEAIYAPESAARIYNNWVSEGFRNEAAFGDSLPKIYDGARRFSNGVVALKLGFSGFHGFTVATSAIYSGVARGVGEIRTGHLIRGARMIAGAPAEFARGVISGKRIVNEWLKPGSSGDPLLAKLADLYAEAGGRAVGLTHENRVTAQGSFWMAAKRATLGKEIRAGLNDVKQNPLKIVPGILHNVGRILETVSYPLFNRYIPHLKAGAFADMMSSWLNRHPGATHEEALTQARQFADSVDNRFGEMVHDNLFQHNTLKQGLGLAALSYTWTLGFLREGIGALNLKQPHRLDAVIGFALTTAAIGGLYQFMKTGQQPTDVRDVVAPKTGGKNPDGTDERVILPGHSKDVIGFWNNGLFGELGNKINPAWPLAKQMASPLWQSGGQDWRGDPFFDPKKSPLDVPPKGTPGWLIGYLNAVLDAYAPITAQTFAKTNGPASHISTAERLMSVRQAPFAVTNPGGFAAFKARQDKAAQTRAAGRK